MSHNPHAEIVCPNCGHHAEYNYCAQCGQPTHLHKDTFFGLITHFVAHYFHYDSKFWKTLKTLWLRPGALTIAYREKKRMRFIDPISLYIFVSAVFFLFFFIKSENVFKKKMLDTKTVVTTKETTNRDTLENVLFSGPGASLVYEKDKKEIAEAVRSDSKTTEGHWFNEQMRRATKNLNERPEYRKAFADSFIHSIPKAVFFMIPFMGMLLSLLFIRRKNTFFVDHGIFALHYHTFWFSIMLLRIINPFQEINRILGSILLLIGMVYFIIAAKRFYEISYRRSIFYAIIIGFFYSIALFVVVFLGGIYAFYQQGA